MKNWIVKIGLVVFFLCVLGSCASSPNTGKRPLQQGEQVIGVVRTTGEGPASWDDLYFFLLEAAKKEYTGSIDIRNISAITGAKNRETGLYTWSATGSVISLGGGNQNIASTGIEGALERATDELSENFTARSRLAIVYITAEDRSQTDFISGELEHILRRRGFVIIDRSELDRIRAEQRFGISGEVDDSTAARIGNIAGASVVITGRVDGEGNLRRLRLRALDTANGQVVGTASERL